MGCPMGCLCRQTATIRKNWRQRGIPLVMRFSFARAGTLMKAEVARNFPVNRQRLT